MGKETLLRPSWCLQTTSLNAARGMCQLAAGHELNSTENQFGVIPLSTHQPCLSNADIKSVASGGLISSTETRTSHHFQERSLDVTPDTFEGAFDFNQLFQEGGPFNFFQPTPQVGTWSRPEKWSELTPWTDWKWSHFSVPSATLFGLVVQHGQKEAEETLVGWLAEFADVPMDHFPISSDKNSQPHSEQFPTKLLKKDSGPSSTE